MSSVQDYIPCPQCGGVYVRDLNCRSQEEYCWCNRCGKIEFSGVEDVIRDGKSRLESVNRSEKGYGVACFRTREGIGTIQPINEPVTAQTKAAYLEVISQHPEIDSASSYLTSWDEEKGDVVAIFGNLPPLYDEEMEASEEVPE